jgi:hypothetical protein
MRHRRSQRDSMTTVSEGETQGDSSSRGRIVMRGMIGKLVLYLVILGIVPSLRRQSTTTTTDMSKETTKRKKKSPRVFRYYSFNVSKKHNPTTPADAAVTVVENVLPYRLASRWSNSIQQEWFQGPNGSWQLSQKQNKWILPSDHPLYQSITLQLQTFLLKSSFLTKIFHISHPTVTITPTNILISHFTTDSYDQNFLNTTSTTNTDELCHSRDDTTAAPSTLYFHLFLLQKVVGMSEHEEESYENKEVNHTWEIHYGGILTPICTNESHCSNLTAITPQFNMGIFWTCTSSITWTLSPISKVALDQHTRFFVVSGDIRIEVVEGELPQHNKEEL